MRVLFINNDGGGYAVPIEVPAGTAVSTLFQEKLPDRKASDFLVRVNRQPTPADQILQEGDRVSFTPTKIDGAVPAAL